MQDFKHGRVAIMIEAAGFELADESELEHGYQYRLENDGIVNVYQNKHGRQTVVLQGHCSRKLKEIFPKGLQINN